MRRPTPVIRRSTRPAASERAGPRRDVLMLEVLSKAEALFATRGFASTSLQDIAKEIGLSRTSMYYYFPSKEALLSELVRGVTEHVTPIFEELEASAELNHAARVAQAARRLVLWVTDPQTHFKLLDRNESDLPEGLAAAHRDTRRRVLAGMTKLVEDGIAAGEFKALNAHVAAFAILGMCNWTAWWFSPEGALSRTEIADQVAGLATTMVQKPAAAESPKAVPVKRGRAKASGATDLKALVASMRQTLDLIDQVGAK